MLLEYSLYFLFLFIVLCSLQIFSSLTFVSSSAISSCFRHRTWSSSVEPICPCLCTRASAAALTASPAVFLHLLVTTLQKFFPGISATWDGRILPEACVGSRGMHGVRQTSTTSTPAPHWLPGPAAAAVSSVLLSQGSPRESVLQAAINSVHTRVCVLMCTRGGGAEVIHGLGPSGCQVAVLVHPFAASAHCGLCGMTCALRTLQLPSPSSCFLLETGLGVPLVPSDFPCF